MIEAVTDWVRGNLPLVVGIAVAVAVGLVAMLLSRRRSADRPGFASGSGSVMSAVQREKAVDWLPPEQSFADRRASVRRGGAPVQVLVASPSFRKGSADGYVLDRSTGGLRIALQVAVPPGSALQVRAADAPDTVGFVTVIVRSCRKNRDFYELGCEFETTPPWNVLLLFG